MAAAVGLCWHLSAVTVSLYWHALAITVSMYGLSHHSRCDISVVCVQSNAANGRDPQSTPLHVCQCPSCFTAFAKSNGVIECVPKCDLADCDESTGVCSEAGSGKGKTVPDWGTHLSKPCTIESVVLQLVLHYQLHKYWILRPWQ